MDTLIKNITDMLKTAELNTLVNIYHTLTSGQDEELKNTESNYDETSIIEDVLEYEVCDDNAYEESILPIEEIVVEYSSISFKEVTASRRTMIIKPGYSYNDDMKYGSHVKYMGDHILVDLISKNDNSIDTYSEKIDIIDISSIYLNIHEFSFSKLSDKIYTIKKDEYFHIDSENMEDIESIRVHGFKIDTDDVSLAYFDRFRLKFTGKVDLSKILKFPNLYDFHLEVECFEGYKGGLLVYPDYPEDVYCLEIDKNYMITMN